MRWNTKPKLLFITIHHNHKYLTGFFISSQNARVTSFMLVFIWNELIIFNDGFIRLPQWGVILIDHFICLVKRYLSIDYPSIQMACNFLFKTVGDSVSMFPGCFLVWKPPFTVYDTDDRVWLTIVTNRGLYEMYQSIWATVLIH